MIIASTVNKKLKGTNFNSYFYVMEIQLVDIENLVPNPSHNFIFLSLFKDELLFLKNTCIVLTLNNLKLSFLISRVLPFCTAFFLTIIALVERDFFLFSLFLSNGAHS